MSLLEKLGLSNKRKIISDGPNRAQRRNHKKRYGVTIPASNKPFTK